MVFTEVVVLKITASSSKVTLFAYATYLNVRRARGENTPHSKIALLVFVCLGEVHTIAEVYCAPFLILFLYGEIVFCVGPFIQNL